MSTHAKILLVTLVALSGSPATAKGQSDEQTVKAVLSKMFNGMRARDSAMMRSTMVPSTMLDRVSATGTLGDPIAMNAFIDRVAAGTGPGGDEQIKDTKIQIDGPMASVWTYYTFTPGGKTAIDHCGVDAFLLRKGPDGWKIFHISDTSRNEGCTPIKK
jgi:hypothetical protein